MIQGTASNVGKSLVVAGLCRHFAQQGLKVAPFKAQNMALNSYVTDDGLEIGRAQAIQADAAMQPCSVHMNPVLLKPEGDKRCQIVLEGRVLESLSAKDYHEMKPRVREIVMDHLNHLRRTHDLVIIEGAGSPAEINLKQHDIVNMFIAKASQSPVLLVGDIDRGGVFASFVGTMELLDPDEKELVKGFIINKFRGDKDLLIDGLKFLEDRTSKHCYGVLPMIRDLRFAEEDSLALEEGKKHLSFSPRKLDIGVLKLPRLSNYDEFDSLEHDRDVHLAYIEDTDQAFDADLLIIPGSKNTVLDLLWLRKNGLDKVIKSRIEKKRPTIAICGGCQMLGSSIKDPDHIESEFEKVEGLNIFSYETTMHGEKVCRRTKYQLLESIFNMPHGMILNGYEIHCGRIHDPSDKQNAFKIFGQGDRSAISFDGRVSINLLATLVHGLFDNDEFRVSMLNFLRERKNLPLKKGMVSKTRNDEYDRIAMSIRSSLNMNLLQDLVTIK